MMPPLPPAASIEPIAGAIVGVIAEGECGLARDQRLDGADAITKWKIVEGFLRERAEGKSVVVVTFDEQVLEACADEIRWLRDGQLISQGDPGEVLAQYRAYVAASIRAGAEGAAAPLLPSFRRGDGRARLESIELLNGHRQPVTAWLSGEQAVIAVSVQFAADVADPVVGILIRTRAGMHVYGTNTQLEGLKLGPVAGGERRRIEYAFACHLCPGQYTVTVASHDPDGIWHDWADDAVAFGVVDSRYTAGVANLRAAVTLVKQVL